MSSRWTLLPKIPPIPPELCGHEGARECREDPFGWLAKVFGMTKEMYFDFNATHGTPLCGCRTISGDLCCKPVGPKRLQPDEFKARHRRSACGIHRDEDIEPPADVPA
jgi:hypothetical protein